MEHPPFVVRLRDATNAHDVEAITACFSAGYVNRTPCHPARSFTGSEQVRRNWTRILAAVADLDATIIDSAVNGDMQWSEWDLHGTRADGSPFAMRGVLIFEVVDGLAASARFYLEPVDERPVDADAAVGEVAGAGG